MGTRGGVNRLFGVLDPPQRQHRAARVPVLSDVTCLAISLTISGGCGCPGPASLSPSFGKSGVSADRGHVAGREQDLVSDRKSSGQTQSESCAGTSPPDAAPLASSMGDEDAGRSKGFESNTGQASTDLGKRDRLGAKEAPRSLENGTRRARLEPEVFEMSPDGAATALGPTPSSRLRRRQRSPKARGSP
jgi:hypothetical protein